MVYRYDPTKLGFRTLVKVHASVFPEVLRRSEFGLLLILHLLFFYFFHTAASYDATLTFLHIGYPELGILSHLTIFFAVFYTNKCYVLYAELYLETKNSFSTCYDLVFELRALTQTTVHQHLRLATRYTMASTTLHFFQMSGAPSGYAWELMLRQGLFLAEEKEYLANYDPNEQCFITLHWASSVIYEGLMRAKCPTSMVKAQLTKLIELANLQMRLRSTIELPVPFQYFHLLNFMIFTTLLLWAYTLAVSLEYTAPVLFLIMEFVLIGMLEMDILLSNPFGHDTLDFQVAKWMYDSFKTSLAVMEYDFPGAADGWKEMLSNELKPPHIEKETLADWATSGEAPPGYVPRFITRILSGCSASACCGVGVQQQSDS